MWEFKYIDWTVSGGKKCALSATFSRIRAQTLPGMTKKKKREKKDVGASYRGYFVLLLTLWRECVFMGSSCVPSLSKRACVSVRRPTPIGSIVHSTWLSLTHTASCLRGSHEPALPLRKETFVTHRPVSHRYTVQTLKKAKEKTENKKKTHLHSDVSCFPSTRHPRVRSSHRENRTVTSTFWSELISGWQLQSLPLR